MKTILVTGANGQLGWEFRQLAAKRKDLDWIFADRNQLDIGEAKAVRSFINPLQIDACINCAAYTAVDKAESEVDTAFRINANGPAFLAEACAGKGVLFFHYSTDYVYHSDQGRPFREDDPTNPLSQYARSKLQGDQRALQSNPRTMILRTSWVYSSVGHNFVRTMLRLGRERDTITVVSDQIGAPTYARDLAEVTLRIFDHMQRDHSRWKDLSGIYHFSNEGVASWYDFAKAIFDLAGISCQVLPIFTVDYPTPAQRPPFSVLNKQKVKETFQMDIPYWRDSLRDCLKEILH